MPGTDVTGGPPGASGFARDHLYRRDPANGLGQVVYARLIAYQPSTLSFIDVSLDASGNLNTAGGGAGGGGASTIADGADVAEGATTDLAVVTDANGTVSGKLRGLVKWAFERMPASLGQKTMAASLPVTVASDQTVIPVSDNAGSLTVDAPVATPVWVRLSDGAAAFVGQKAMAASLPVVVASDQSAIPVTAAQSGAPWAENITQVGGVALALKALPAGGSGQAALPVWNAAIQFLTYDAGARAIVTGALTANTAKAVLSIEHSAAATKNVRIRRIIAHMIQTTALSGLIELELHRGTAASSAGTVRTPTPRNAADAAAEAVVKSLPTIVAGTVLDTFPLGGFGATTALYSPPVVVYDWQEAGETKTYILRAGVLESFVLNVISTAAHNLTMAIAIDFTEE